MSKLVAALATLVLLTSPSAASVVRIDLTKATQSKSPLKYAIKTTTIDKLVLVNLELPRTQTPLEHLWRIDLVMRGRNQTQLIAPLESKLVGGVLKVDLHLDPAAMTGAEIWIRTGATAPLAETVYVINVGSFK